MGKELKIYKNLTLKQLVFVKRILAGESGTQAALAAYNTHNPNVAKVIASENLTKPNIRKAIEGSLNSQGLSLSMAISNIKEVACSKPQKITGDSKLKANIELLKLMGAYTDKKTTDTDKFVQRGLSFDDAKKYFNQLSIEIKRLIEEVESS